MNKMLPVLIIVVGALAAFFIWQQSKKQTTTTVPVTTLPTGTAGSAADDAAAVAAAALKAAQDAAAKAQLDAYAATQAQAALVAAGAEAAAILAATQAANKAQQDAAAAAALAAQQAETQLAASQAALIAQYKSEIANLQGLLTTAQTAVDNASSIYNGATSKLAGYANAVAVARQSLADIQAIYNNLETFLGFTPGKAEVQAQLSAAQAAFTAAVNRYSVAMSDANSAKTALLNAITSANLIIERSLSEAGDYRILQLVNAEATRLTQIATATRNAIASLAAQINNTTTTTTDISYPQPAYAPPTTPTIPTGTPSQGGGTTVAISASLSVTSISRGGTVIVTAAGFQPNSQINISVMGGGGFTGTTDSSGGGCWSFVSGEAIGVYTVHASDAYGHSANATFNVS
jgi:hypothetical protein